MVLGPALLLASACGTTTKHHTGAAPKIPHFAEQGSRLREFSSLSDLAKASGALLEGVPTGKQTSVQLPKEQGGTATSAPIVFVEMRVTKVLSGSVNGDTIEVVSPGTDTNTDKPALLSGGPYLMFLTPAMYDIDAPAGGYTAGHHPFGYALTGGPAGLYAPGGEADEFLRVDDVSDKLPPQVNLRTTSFPKVTRTEVDLIKTGGF